MVERKGGGVGVLPRSHSLNSLFFFTNSFTTTYPGSSKHPAPPKCAPGSLQFAAIRNQDPKTNNPPLYFCSSPHSTRHSSKTKMKTNQNPLHRLFRSKKSETPQKEKKKKRNGRTSTASAETSTLSPAALRCFQASLLAARHEPQLEEQPEIERKENKNKTNRSVAPS